jgi:superfamily II DNA or RNA helicase
MENYPIEKVILIYNKHIYDRYKSLIDSGKTNEILTNNDLAKIFEYYSCIMLMNEYKEKFYEYDDINPDFKELHQMSRTDTGIDACNLTDTIVQCKLRQSNTNLNWKECATFFGSNVYTNEDDILSIRWKKMIITRNSDCNLSKHFDCRKKSFKDKTYDRNEMITYCKTLLENPPVVNEMNEVNNTELIQHKITLRDYQFECKKLILETKANLVICLPTGTGKNLIILHSLKEKTKYLILVPRIILMEQIRDDLKLHLPKLARSVQCIGDGENVYDDKKYIYICVYNSINVVKEYGEIFEKIFIDEAHHIREPEIYQQIEDDYSVENYSGDEEEIDSEDEEDEEDVLEDNYKTSEETRELEGLKPSQSFIDEISSLSRYNNVVYLSATIDIQEGITYYKKDLREMIEKKYLCDYTIHIPIFNDDPTNKSVCEYLIKNYRNVIIYCNSQKEGNEINKLINTIQKGCCDYIDCNTGKIKRNKILKEYKEGKIPFLVNVRILVEGFDSPITKGVVFMHLPSNSKTLIQIIGRCLRLHKEKTIANIILPFAEKCDEDSINNFLKVMAKNDSKIKKSYESKQLGGYISIDTVNNKLEDDEEDDEEDLDEKEHNNSNDIELRFNMIFDSMGKMKNFSELWLKRFNEVKTYIDKNGKRPTHSSKDKYVKSLGKWLIKCMYDYDTNLHNMKDENIRKLWEEFSNNEKYKLYFLSQYDSFIFRLNQIKQYIDINKKRPTEDSKNKDIKIMCKWLGQYIYYYNKKKYIMKDENIYNQFSNFINDEKYKKYFRSQYDSFLFDLNKVKTYIDTYKERPSKHSNDNNIKSMGSWIASCVNNYTKKEYRMKDENIYKLWTDFTNDDKYKKYFSTITMLELFNITFIKVKNYIDTYKKRPFTNSKDKDIKFLGCWIGNCQTNYNKKTQNMKDETIYKLWTDFINNERYKEYFLSQYDSFVEILNKLKTYIDINKIKPSSSNKDKKIQYLYNFVNHCNKSYTNKIKRMKDENIRKLWKNFINDKKYKIYFN